MKIRNSNKLLIILNAVCVFWINYITLYLGTNDISLNWWQLLLLCCVPSIIILAITLSIIFSINKEQQYLSENNKINKNCWFYCNKAV